MRNIKTLIIAFIAGALFAVAWYWYSNDGERGVPAEPLAHLEPVRELPTVPPDKVCIVKSDCVVVTCGIKLEMPTQAINVNYRDAWYQINGCLMPQVRGYSKFYAQGASYYADCEMGACMVKVGRKPVRPPALSIH